MSERRGGAAWAGLLGGEREVAELASDSAEILGGECEAESDGGQEGALQRVQLCEMQAADASPAEQQPSALADEGL